MSLVRSRLALASAVVLLALPAATPSWAAGNLFDAIGEALFGKPAARFTPPEPESGPLSVTVGPRRSDPAQARPRYITAKPKLPAIKLDAENDPTWYLKDPTLRRGDIIVLKTGVVVFDGQPKAEHFSIDFTPLGQTRLLSPIRRQEIAEMARGIKTPSAAKPALGPTALRPQTEASAAP
jgi:hypothetical protein